MVFIVKDPILSYFNSLSTFFRGFGINVRLGVPYTTPDIVTKCRDAKFQFIRILIDAPDPTSGALVLAQLNDMDNVFKNAPYATDGSTDEDGNTTPSTATQFFNQIKSLSNGSIRCIFCFLPPVSWLDVDGYLTGDAALSGYANYVLSGLKWASTFAISADMVELFPEPDLSDNGRVYPRDLVVIANRIRDLSISRGMLNPAIKILGPGLSEILPNTTNIGVELYTESFIYSRSSLDGFSIHALENNADEPLYNSGSINGRKVMEKCLAKSVAQMNAVNFSLEHLVTLFATKATKFPKTAYHYDPAPVEGETVDTLQYGYATNDDGSITPTVLADSQEYVLRIVENFINCLSEGFFGTLYSDLSPITLSDGTVANPMQSSRSLWDETGTKPRLLLGMFEKLQSITPLPAVIYRSEEINVEEDYTVKLFLTSSNGEKFVFILCRPVKPDNLIGRLRLTVNNPLWSTNYVVSNIKFSSFPDPAVVTTSTQTDAFGKTTVVKQIGNGVDLSSMTCKATVSLNNISFFLNNVPYGGCCIFVTGDIKLKDPVTPPAPTPAPAPTPSPTPAPSPGDGTVDMPPTESSPVVMSTIMQMPVNYGEPRWTNYSVGTVYYDSKDKVVKTFINGVWISSHLLTYT